MASELLSWARGNGATASEEIQFSQLGSGSDSNYGAVAAEPCTDATIAVPLKITIKLSDAIASFGPEWTDSVLKTRSINALSKLFLAREKSRGLASFYSPYISLLPETIDSPYTWPPADLAKLKGSNLGSLLRSNLAEIIEEWWSVVSLLSDKILKPESHFMNLKFYYEHKFYKDDDMYEYLHALDFQNWTLFPCFLWALMIYKSRSFPSYILKDHAGAQQIDYVQPDVAVLLPLVDLLNHNRQAKVLWGCKDGSFTFESHDLYKKGDQIFNNYGQKGNEELLLAYGFCINDNPADLVALRIKIPDHIIPELQEKGVQLPSLSDYTTLVVNDTGSTDKPLSSADGYLFFIGKGGVVPDNLVDVFSWLVRSRWENSLSVRMQFAGLNHLRQALESKALLLQPQNLGSLARDCNIRTYMELQRQILQDAAKSLKKKEKEMLAAEKGKLLLLKLVFKKDEKFAQSLLVTMGVTSYDDIVQGGYADQVWLLYLIRCFNRALYAEDSFLPEWIYKCFARMDKEVDIPPEEVLQFRELYENVVLPMNSAVPEIYGVGTWTVRELIVSTKVMDTIGFVRGKEQECILVNDLKNYGFKEN